MKSNRAVHGRNPCKEIVGCALIPKIGYHLIEFGGDGCIKRVDRALVKNLLPGIYFVFSPK